MYAKQSSSFTLAYYFLLTKEGGCTHTHTHTPPPTHTHRSAHTHVSTHTRARAHTHTHTQYTSARHLKHDYDFLNVGWGQHNFYVDMSYFSQSKHTKSFAGKALRVSVPFSPQRGERLVDLQPKPSTSVQRHVQWWWERSAALKRDKWSSSELTLDQTGIIVHSASRCSRPTTWWFHRTPLGPSLWEAGPSIIKAKVFLNNNKKTLSLLVFRYHRMSSLVN